MKKLLFPLVYILGFLLFPRMLFSQIEITAGAAFPLGSYLDEVQTFPLNNNKIFKLPDGNYLYGAQIGMDVGLKYRLKIHQNLGAFCGVNMIWNPVKKDFKKHIENNIGLITGDYNVKTGQYFHIPIMAGLHYTYHASKEFGIFVEAGGGVNLLQRSPFQITATIQNYVDENKSYDFEILSKYDLATTFCFQAGVGAVVNNRFLISVHYYGLGSSPAKGTTTTKGFTALIDDLNNLETQIPLLTDFLNSFNGNIDKSLKFNSERKMFSQVISFTFGVRFGVCKKEKNKTSITTEKKNI